MSFTVEKLPDANIILTILHADYSLKDEIALSDQASLDISDTGDPNDRYILVIEFHVQLSLEDIMVGANRIARGEKAIWYHPKVAKVHVVTDNAVIQMASRGLSSKTFGNLNVEVFNSREAAIEQAHAEIMPLQE